MKIFQIKDRFCFYDATSVHHTLESTYGMYSPEIVFVEAPDYVREGWGYDDSKEGDERFLQPIPPEGWLYDMATGTFYPEDGQPPKPELTKQQLEAKITELEDQLAAAKILLGVE